LGHRPFAKRLNCREQNGIHAHAEKGASLTSANGAYTLTLQDDGNLVLAAGGQAVWATDANGQDVVRAEVQTDGNFVLSTPDKPVWDTDAKGAKDVKLVLQDDRNVVPYAADGPAWSSTTDTTEAPPPAPEATLWHPIPLRRPRKHPRVRRRPNPLRRRRLPRGRTRWLPATPCGRSRNSFTVTAASTR
jgi:hypothetical protein